MSYLRQKSEFNLYAAKELISKELFAPSVHCSYYSCFQLMKYAIHHFFGITYEQQIRNMQNSKPKQNSHQYVINYINCELEKNRDFFEVQNFRRNIKDLKQFRIEADYENIEVTFEKGQLAIEKAEKIRNYLITNLHL